MKRILLSLVLLFSILTPMSVAAATDPLYVKTPAKIEVDPGRIQEINIDTNAKKVIWLLTDKKADLIRLSDTKGIFSSLTPGDYIIYLFIAQGDEPKGPYTIKVTVSGLVPPGPNPGPLPVPPVPADEFTKALKDAYSADAGVDKLKFKDLLSKVFKDAIDNVLADKEIDTIGKVFTVIAMNGRDVLADNLTPLRQVISRELQKNVPTDTNKKVDDEVKALLKTQFQKVIAALEKI